MTPAAPKPDSVRRDDSARSTLRNEWDRDLDRHLDRHLDGALRGAFADLDAPPRVEIEVPEPARGARASARRPWELGVAAAAAFLLCAVLPMLVVRSELGLRVGDALMPWVLRCAPALVLPAWMWLERAPTRRLHDVETG